MQFSQTNKVNQLVQTLMLLWFDSCSVECIVVHEYWLCLWITWMIHAMLQGSAGSGSSWADGGIWAALCSLGLFQIPGQPKSSGSSAARDPPWRWEELPLNLQPGIVVSLKTSASRFGSSGWAAKTQIIISFQIVKRYSTIWKENS